MSSSRKISAAEKAQYIQALRTHQINTLVELRRIEKAFAVLGTPDCSEPMTSAWSYYVDSHSLLTELRGLTRNYPFSQLVPYYARYQASLPAMWAGHTPSSEQINQLTDAFVAEWNWALGQMLRHWEQPPTQ
ncbi:Nn.00g094860.m01.CDS01 [Neocucurbitaria sp. VM-36]